MTASNYLTVKALTKYIKRKFDADPHLREVYVVGELSNVKHHHASGHIYFTLKDEETRIKAVMYKGSASKLAFKPEDGMKVYIRGDVNVYERDGNYQLYAQTMEPEGIGGLMLAFNQLKDKLKEEGLFDMQLKKPIPTFPKTIGVITATSGAVIRDICTTIKRRYPLVEILVYPTLVQGVQAAPSIAENIALANKQKLCDILIVARGGGSIEDLWAFNEEIVARAIFASELPIISAVGHETDTTIADFVADLRAPTPTAAAELAVPNQQELLQKIFTFQKQIHFNVSNQIQNEKAKLAKLNQSYPLATPERLYRPFIERLASLETNLEQAMQMSIMQKKNAIAKLETILLQQSPKYKINMHTKQVEYLQNQLTKAVNHLMAQKKQLFQSQVRTLEALNPLSILSKGFTVTYKDDVMVKSVKKLKKNDSLSIKFVDGVVHTKIKDIEPLKKGDK